MPDDSELRSRVIDPVSGEELLDLGPRQVLLASGRDFSPAGTFEPGRYLAVSIGSDDVEIYDMQTRSLLSTLGLEGDFIFSAAFDPTGRYLHGGTQHGRAWVMDFAAVVDGTPASDALVMNVVAHVGGVPIQVMNADGVLATGAVNGTLRLWDVSQGALIVELERDMDSLPFVAFSPDGEYLYYSDLGQAGYVIRRFALDPEQLVALAESRVTRELTEDECRRFPSAPPCG